jgi:hypothetical protein
MTTVTQFTGDDEILALGAEIERRQAVLETVDVHLRILQVAMHAIIDHCEKELGWTPEEAIDEGWHWQRQTGQDRLIEVAEARSEAIDKLVRRMWSLKATSPAARGRQGARAHRNVV